MELVSMPTCCRPSWQHRWASSRSSSVQRALYRPSWTHKASHRLSWAARLAWGLELAGEVSVISFNPHELV